MVKGFRIQEDGTRAPEDYGSNTERAHCECHDLLTHKQYAEAYDKLDEYHALNNGFINKNDWMFILKVEVGYLNVKPTKKNFANSVDAWNSAAFQDGGCHTDDLVRIAGQIVTHYERANKIDVGKYGDDFSKVSVGKTIQLVDFILKSFLVLGADINMNLHEYDDFLDPVIFGIRHLIDKGDKQRARGLYDKVVGAGCGDYAEFMQRQGFDW
eukprot:CAMPEP_0178706830 /NCGR_PEP_ID=MMETSP0699-20121125/15639_1 /TAXON_ID=265572 /ORGANISM="Extubocellulus spinifer, Strain CCMP396" /LENGTH=211 /DNA_ID=CAMNT_0020354703 /DNA_START=101 /DNA_END=733 /DNA_ORIENTATION=+